VNADTIILLMNNVETLVRKLNTLMLVATLACHSKDQVIPREFRAAATAVSSPDTAPTSLYDASTPNRGAAELYFGQDAGCTVLVGVTLSASIFRGVRDTGARRAAIATLDPTTRATWERRDHAYGYLLCKYAVLMNERRYTYEHEAGQQLGHMTALDPALCSTDATRATVTKDIVRSTKGCADPHGGAYWGGDLEALSQ
jgi:hypothetical protein